MAPPVMMIGPSAPNGPPVPMEMAEDTGFNTALLHDAALRGRYHGNPLHRVILPGPGEPLEEALSHAGIAMEEISAVGLSHLHLDHAGGVGRGGGRSGGGGRRAGRERRPGRQAEQQRDNHGTASGHPDAPAPSCHATSRACRQRPIQVGSSVSYPKG